MTFLRHTTATALFQSRNHPATIFTRGISAVKTARSIHVQDFRSDTVTRPTAAMFDSMATASTGDDVMGEDKSTRDLETWIADLTGHEDAMFGVSGTMTNQLALRCWLRGALQSVLLDGRSHIYKYENAGISYHSQAGTNPVRPFPGTSHLTLDRILPNIVHEDIHCAQTRVIALENTLNGSIFSLPEIQKISEFTKKEKLILHLDGARLWNASAETGISLKEWCQPFDTVSLCLSKGIGAPVGSILVGPRELIRSARHFRKLFGGGWRQSGPLAAAARHAIEHTFLDTRAVEGKRSRMKQDHENARWLARELSSRIPKLKISNKIETNMVFVDIRYICEGINVERLVKQVDFLMATRIQKGESNIVKIAAFGYAFDSGERDLTVEDHDFVFRLVLHYQIDREGCKLLVDTIEEAVFQLKKTILA